MLCPVSRDNLLSIGSFGLLTGLSVTTLRHCDDAGVLEPAFVDPETSYRYYHPNQVRRARVIQRLRAVDLANQRHQERPGNAGGGRRP
jgi:DNA-binding transcriptional MerR regulator